MPENKPFVINDRRKFTAEGELRPDAPRDLSADEASVKETAVPETANEDRRVDNVMPFEVKAPEARSSSAVAETPDSSEPASAVNGLAGTASETVDDMADDLPPMPTDEEIAQVSRAYEATVDRLDTALRATNPGGERIPPMTFERVVQSLYMQALMQLGGAAEPGQPPRLDLIGARQTVEMLSVLAAKATGNLNDTEEKLLTSALFELRMGFLEVTQALARQAAGRQPGGGLQGVPGGPGGPSIVR